MGLWRIALKIENSRNGKSTHFLIDMDTQIVFQLGFTIETLTKTPKSKKNQGICNATNFNELVLQAQKELDKKSEHFKHLLQIISSKIIFLEFSERGIHAKKTDPKKIGSHVA